MMQDCKRYGCEKTDLQLTEKAEKVYNNSCPLVIYEISKGRYTMRGIIDRENLTSVEVSETLEAFAE